MHIALFCATRRGLRFLQRLTELLSASDELTVISFREQPHEPAFFDDIRALAERHGAAFHEAKRLHNIQWERDWNRKGIDLLLAVNWRYFIPPDVYSCATIGAYVFHDSLLPKYRGFSPTVWAIINGENHTGVTLFEMSETVDSGRIVAQKRVPISPNATIAEVIDDVTTTYIQLLDAHIDALRSGSVSARPQNEDAATYTCKLLPKDCCIDWHRTSLETYNLIRGYSAPYPGAYTYLDGTLLRVWSAEPIHDSKRYVGCIPGRIVDIVPKSGVVVLTGDGRILLQRVQLESGPETTADNVINSYTTTLGLSPGR